MKEDRLRTIIKFVCCRFTGLRSKKDIRVINHGIACVLAGCLAWMTASCEKEYIPDIPETPDIEQPALTVTEGNFSINLSFAGFGEELSRAETQTIDISVRQHDLEPETSVIRVSDGLYLYATLAVDPAVRTQAVKTQAVKSLPVGTRKFNDGAKILIAIYDSVDTNTFAYETEVMYRDSSGTFVRADASGFKINLDAGNYKLIAYSLNTADDPPALLDTLKNIDPSNDLIWGMSPTVPLAGNDKIKIPITLVHKMSQVRLVAATRDAGAKITGFSDVTMSGYTVDMASFTGALAANTDITQAFTFSTATFPADSVKSDTRTVFTAGDMPTIIRIGTLGTTINGRDTTVSDIPATFAKSLLSGYSYTMTMRIGDSPLITDDTPPPGFTPYVGAFWKAGQTGERLIRMKVTTGEADSVWTAQVIEGRDWIVLDTAPSTDANVWMPNPDALGNDDGFDDAHRLTGTSTFVSGFARLASDPESQPGDDQIYFRIGLKSEHTITEEAPVRYGVVLLTYGNNRYRQRIWIRQGDAPDYVFSNSDPVPAGAAVAQRTVARKFSPYNLTAATLNAPVSVNGIPLDPPIQNDPPAILTDYPTRAGAFFQWATPGPTIRYAWDPVSQFKPGWDVTPLPSNVFWADLGADQETCPPGFRRPTDGLTNAADAGPDVSLSEMRQSLYENPPQSSNVRPDGVNTVYGYYADGFFDRMDITDGPGTNSPGLLSSVAATDAGRVAHRGTLFYNRHTLASLFFPSAGSVNTSLSEAGNAGYYLSSTAFSTTPNYSIYATGSAGQNVINANVGASVRCVRRPDGTLLCFNNSTQGKEFWVSFGENNAGVDGSYRFELRIASEFSTTVTLTFTDGGAQAVYAVNAGEVLHIDLSNIPVLGDMQNAVYLAYTDGITPPNGSSNKTLKITSDAPVSVYAFNTQTATTDATALLPVTAWGKDYYRLSYQPAETQFDFEMIIANQSGTIIYEAGSLTSIDTLSAGEVYYNVSNTDMTGRRIFADKPVAYFTHSTIAEVPHGRRYADILFEQLAPVNQWGYRFLVPNAPQPNNSDPRLNRIRILASQPNTKVSFTGATVALLQDDDETPIPDETDISLTGGILQAGQWTELEITGSDRTKAACYIEADKPVGVVSYMVGTGSVSNAGDPSICWIPAVDRQMVQREIISPFMFPPGTSGTFLDEEGINIHYMIIITPSATATDTKVNDAPLPGVWVDNPSGFSHYIWNFKSPVGTDPGDMNNDFKIENPNGIIVLAGGTSTAESYYYNAGSGTCNVIGN
ncbi:MAG: hypothetical protein LBE56_13845 [Tannerella sp.]|nr:hypothetical protein [Tannerella sp.]